MNRLLFSYFLFSLPILVSAQGIPISGKIVIEELTETIDLSLISILNETTNAKTNANSLGVFTLKVAKDDVIIITSNFTEQRRIKISEAILNKGFITVHLDLEIIQLDEKSIQPLKKDLKDNISKEDSDKTKLYKSLGLNPDLQYIEVNPNVTSTINHNGWLQDPNLWIAALTGQRKKDIKRNEFFKKENKLEDVKDYFTENYFEQNLKIPKYKISEFLRYCYAQKSFNLKVLIDGNRYEEIEEILEKEAPLYLNLLNDNS